MAQPNLWGGVLDGLQNPLTMGGLSLLTGGDLNSGIQAGTALQRQAQQKRQQEALQQGLMGMPNMTDNDRQILGASPDLANDVLSNIYKSRFDPNAGLEADYKRAQIRKLTAEANNEGSAYGKAGTIVQGPDNKFYSVQFGSGGQRKIEPLELGSPGPQGAPVSLKPSRGVSVSGDLMYDKATGDTVRNVAPNIAGGEAAKVTGRETAEGQMALPKAKIALQQYEAQNDIVNSNIDRAIEQASGWTTGLAGSATSAVPGTPAHDLRNTLNTIKANLGFDKLQDMRNNSPTGGALGQVSEMENILLQSVYGSLEQSQSKEQFVGNLGKIKTIRQQYKALKQQAYEQDVARFGAANVPNPTTGAATTVPKSPAPGLKSGRYRFNSQTGDVEPIE